MFSHVDDGLMFGPSIQIIPLILALVDSSRDAHCGRRLAQLDDQIFSLGRVIVRTTRGYSVEANPMFFRDVIGWRLQVSREQQTTE